MVWLAVRMNVESWCVVEATPQQSWRRVHRKHFPNAMKSTVFGKKLPDRFADMHTAKPSGIRVDELQKKRHFKEKCESSAI